MAGIDRENRAPGATPLLIVMQTIEGWTAGAAHERQVHRILSVELLVLLGRVAKHLVSFADIVEETMSPHPAGCFVALFGNPAVRVQWRAAMEACMDARTHLMDTVNTWGYGWRELDDPLPKARVVRRLPRPKGEHWPMRSGMMWEMLGWLTPHELALFKRLSLGLDWPAVLEHREGVNSWRFPTLSAQRPDGGTDTHPMPELRADDVHIAQQYPILVRPEMDQYHLAVTSANVAKVRMLGKALKVWRPERFRPRQLAETCGELVSLTGRVVHMGPVPPAGPPLVETKPLAKPDGWTRAELVRQAKETTDLSPSTFDAIRKAAQIPAAERGGRGQQRRYGREQVRLLATAASRGPFRQGADIAKALRQLVGE